jgi:hypothetical protein
MGKIGKIFFFLSVMSLLSFAVVRFLLGVWVPFLWVSLGMFVGFLVAGFWVDRRFYQEFFSMKNTKQGMSMGAMIALVLILLVAVNFIAVRKYKTFDFSLARVNTLSDQSIKLVKDLKEDMRVLYFYKDGTEGIEANRRAFIELVKKYQDQSDRLKLEFVEVNERPDLAEKYKIQQATQVVVLDYQGRQSRIEKIDEQELTSAIVKVTRVADKKIYILSGHHEYSIEPSKDGSSIALLKELLLNSRYVVEEHTFTQSTQVPKDADILIIPAPRMNFLDVEVRAIEDYLKRGGSLILALETGFKTGLEGLLKTIGITSQNNYIATVLQTPMGTAVDPRFARGSDFSKMHQITKPFADNQFTVFRLPTALRKSEKAVPGISLDELVKTSASVMGFKDTQFNKEGEKGPYTVAIAAKGKLPGASVKEEFNLLVFGDADFLNDQYLYQNLNRDLALNSVAFLAKEENLISVTPKEVEISELTMTDTQFILFIFGFIVPLPLLLFVASGVLWYKRRYS